MQKPEIPRNENYRIEALDNLAILDTDPDPHLDFITKIVKERFNVPIALISLVDKNRQWFKSHQGLSATETPRDISFCGHAILQSEVFEVSNAIQDARFQDNPLVLGPPNIRFYAGYPLTIDGGFKIGTLCIIDTEPRKLSKENKEELKSFAGLIQDHLNKKDRESHIEKLIDQSVDSYFEIDMDQKFIYVNAFGASMLGYKKEELIGSKLNLILPKKRFDGSSYHPEKFGGIHAMQHAVVHQSEEDLMQKDGTIIHASCNFQPIFRMGKVVSVLMSFRDNFERDSLMAELYWQRENLDKIINAQILSLKLRGSRQKPRI
jgi:PAS domain S-box-containing protein